MKTLTTLLSAAAIAAGSLGVTAVANADVSYNVGYVSEYYYRGIYQRIPLPALVSTTRKAGSTLVLGRQMLVTV